MSYRAFIHNFLHWNANIYKKPTKDLPSIPDWLPVGGAWDHQHISGQLGEDGIFSISQANWRKLGSSAYLEKAKVHLNGDSEEEK